MTKFSFGSIPETMNALQMTGYGPADQVLKYNKVKSPKIKHPNEVLVKVKAIGVNPAETKVRSGNSTLMFSVNLPSILGSDYAGIVAAKGADVKDFEIGDAVYGALSVPFGREYGTYAEYTLVIQGRDRIVKKPEELTFEEAAAQGIACGTAFEGIVVRSQLPKAGPKKVLIIGASGGVGTYAVQIAKAIGAEVVAICSSKNSDLVRSLGADRIIDYTDKSQLHGLASEKESYDTIFDAVGGDDYYSLLLPILKPKAVYSSAAGPVRHIGSEKMSVFSILKFLATVASRKLFGSHPYELIACMAVDRFSTEIAPFFSEGKIKSVILDGNVLELKDGAKAHERLESHRTVGKIVLQVNQ